LNIAEKNLNLLSKDGIQKRIGELQEYIKLYNKESHIGALKDALELLSLNTNRKNKIEISCETQSI
jgi:uncharacterized small protein (DUF1192 family)